MLKNRKYFIYLILLAIFAIALLLRIYRLGEFPVGFHIDEASLGYNAYSLLQTGRDDNGKLLPLYIDMFGDNRPAGYHYLTILPVKLLGLTEFSTRFTGVLFGSMVIIATYIFTYAIFNSKKISILSSFLIAISPWHFVLSRASAEVMVSLFFILTGFGLFFQSFRNKKIIYLITGSVLMTASFFFYHTPRVFVPGFFLVSVLVFFSLLRNYSKKYRISVLASFIVVSLVALFLVFGISGGTGRYSQVNIFSSFETDFFQKQQIQEDAIAGSNHVISRFFHNKITNIVLVFVSNYFDYFGFNFLFTTGGLPIWYSIPRAGLLYLVELPFILIGIYGLIKSKDKISKIPLVWLLFAPIVPAITMDDVPNINRVVVMFPILNIFAAIGFLTFVRNSKYRKYVAILIGMLLLINFSYFLHQYFYNAKTHNPWFRNNGFSEMMSEVKKNYDEYDVIAISKYQGGIYPLILFYMKYDPKRYQEEGSPKNKDYGGFGKFFFVPQDCPSFQTKNRLPANKRILYIDKGDCPVEKGSTLGKHTYIYREDGTKAFRVVYDKSL